MLSCQRHLFSLPDGLHYLRDSNISFAAMEQGEREELGRTMAATGLTGVEAYLAHLENAGFHDVTHEDLSPWWRDILRARMEMFESLRDETVRRFGEARHAKYMAAYRFFVDMIESGKLGGGRFTASK